MANRKRRWFLATVVGIGIGLRVFGTSGDVLATAQAAPLGALGELFLGDAEDDARLSAQKLCALDTAARQEAGITVDSALCQTLRGETPPQAAASASTLAPKLQVLEALQTRS